MFAPPRARCSCQRAGRRDHPGRRLVVRGLVRAEDDAADRAGEHVERGYRNEARAERTAGRALTVPDDGRDLRACERCGHARRRGRRRRELCADLVEIRRDALRREEARRGGVGERAGGVQRVAQGGAVLLRLRVFRLAEVQVAEERAAVERSAVGRPEARGRDQQVRLVLCEERGGLGVQCGRRGLPDSLVDSDRRACEATEVVEVHGVARDARRVDGAGEPDREPRLDVEPVEPVEHGHVGAVRGVRDAVRLRQIDPQTRDLRGVGCRQEVCRERRAGGDAGRGEAGRQQEPGCREDE